MFLLIISFIHTGCQGVITETRGLYPKNTVGYKQKVFEFVNKNCQIHNMTICKEQGISIDCRSITNRKDFWINKKFKSMLLGKGCECVIKLHDVPINNFKIM